MFDANSPNQRTTIIMQDKWPLGQLRRGPSRVPLLQLLGLKPRRSMSMTTAKVHSTLVELLIAG